MFPHHVLNSTTILYHIFYSKLELFTGVPNVSEKKKCDGPIKVAILQKKKNHTLGEPHN